MKKWIPLIASCLGTFMLLVDVTIVTVALPDIAAATHSPFSTLQWVLDAYALVLGALVLGMGSLADNLGHKRVYIGGTALFAVASLGCGLASSGAELVMFRAIQGIGGAAMFATTTALLHATYSGRDRGVAFGVWGAVSGASAGIGVIAGGVLTEWAGWRWVFIVNVPVSLCAIVLSLLVFRETRRGHARLDLPGIALFTLAAAALIFGIIRGGEDGWSSDVAITALVVAVLALVAFVIVEARAAAPMLPLHLLRIPRFAGSLVAALGMNFSAFSGSILLSLWLQTMLHLSAIGTGLAMLPMASTAFVVSGALGHRLDGAPPQRTIGLGIVMIGAGSLLLTLIGADSHWWVSTPGLVVIGVGVGLSAPALASVALGAVPPQLSGTASGAVNTGRQIGFALGVAVLGSVFAASAGSSHVTNTQHFVDGLHSAMIVAGVVGVVAGLASIALFSRDRAPGAVEPETVSV